jgi:hypothetical protein
MRRGLLRLFALGQAGVYLTTGLWPIVHLRSFEAVTGPKHDDWLARANGAVFAAIGAGLGLAAARDRLTPEWRALAIALALGVTGVEAQARLTGAIPPIYWLDAAFETTSALVWATLGRSLRPLEGGEGTSGAAAALSPR